MKKILSLINFLRDFFGAFFVLIGLGIGSKSFKEILSKAIKVGLDCQLEAYKKVLEEIKRK